VTHFSCKCSTESKIPISDTVWRFSDIRNYDSKERWLKRVRWVVPLTTTLAIERVQGEFHSHESFGLQNLFHMSPACITEHRRMNWSSVSTGGPELPQEDWILGL